MTKTYFISHATKDDDPLVNRIADTLEREGFGTWVDHRRGGLSPKDADWEKSLREALKKCDGGILVMTENSLASSVCKSECLFVQESKKPLYIICAEACDRQHIWLTIKLIQYANIIDQFDLGMNNLIRALRGDDDPALPTPFYITGMSGMVDSISNLDIPLRGRDTDVNHVRDLLKTGGLVQVIAVGGWGKSRLCAEIALSHPHGAVWHFCRPFTSKNDVLIALREHLNLSTDANEAVVADRMAERRSLLVIDNAEDVSQTDRADYLALFAQLAHRGVPILLTSREKWHANKFATRAYTLPDFTDANLADVMQITHDFYAKFGKTFTDDEAKQLAKAGRFHPELIEIAVGLIGGGEYEFHTIIQRLNELHPRDIQEALDEIITKTLIQMRDRTPDGAKGYALIHNLTWLQASFTSDVIRALKPDSISDDELPDVLATLRRYQFLRYDDITKRYRIPDLVRDAIGTPKDPALFGIYADFYTVRAKEIFDGTPVQHWADKEGEANFDDVVNIKALGGELMRQTQNGTMGDLARALEFAVMTRRYVTDRMEEKAWAWLEMGLNAVRLLRRNMIDNLGLIDKEALMLSELGTVIKDLGYRNKALQYYTESLELRRKRGDKWNEAIILNNIGIVLEDKYQALKYFERSLVMNWQVGNKRMVATALSNIGVIYYESKEFYKALNYYEQALHISREMRDRSGEASILNKIGLVYSALAQNGKDVLNGKDMLSYYEQALEISREVGNRGGQAEALNNIGGLYFIMDENHKALAYYEQALPVYSEVGDKAGEAVTCVNIGSGYEALGDLDKAIEWVEQCVILEEQIQHRDLEVNRQYLISLKRKRGDADVPS